jgi:predicted metal-dependent hydrolase
MQVRFPKWDFSGLRAHWSPHHEFAQIHNAASTVPAYIEPYLLKVMRLAKQRIDPSHGELHRTLDIFIKQEMQHCKLHLAFNKAIRSDGYDGMLPFEKQYEADYDRYLKTRSLRFNLAYAEGFEAMSAIAVTNFFEEFDAFLDGADPRAVAMWKWHLAEEYEHREVAFDVYHALYGNGLFAWGYRLYGFYCAITHIRAHTRRVTDYLLTKDRAGMNEGALAASLAREKDVSSRTSKRAKEHLKAIMSWNYNPATRPAPRGLQVWLDQLTQEMAAAA